MEYLSKNWKDNLTPEEIETVENKMVGNILCSRYLFRIYRGIFFLTAINLTGFIITSLIVKPPIVGVIIFSVAFIFMFAVILKEMKLLAGGWKYLFKKPAGETLEELFAILYPRIYSRLVNEFD